MRGNGPRRYTKLKPWELVACHQTGKQNTNTDTGNLASVRSGQLYDPERAKLQQEFERQMNGQNATTGSQDDKTTYGTQKNPWDPGPNSAATTGAPPPGRGPSAPPDKTQNIVQREGTQAAPPGGSTQTINGPYMADSVAGPSQPSYSGGPLGAFGGAAGSYEASAPVGPNGERYDPNAHQDIGQFSTGAVGGPDRSTGNWNINPNTTGAQLDQWGQQLQQWDAASRAAANSNATPAVGGPAGQTLAQQQAAFRAATATPNSAGTSNAPDPRNLASSASGFPAASPYAGTSSAETAPAANTSTATVGRGPINQANPTGDPYTPQAPPQTSTEAAPAVPEPRMPIDPNNQPQRPPTTIVQPTPGIDPTARGGDSANYTWGSGGASGNANMATGAAFQGLSQMYQNPVSQETKNAMTQETMNAANAQTAGASEALQRNAASTGNNAGVAAAMAQLGRDRAGIGEQAARENVISQDQLTNQRQQAALSGFANIGQQQSQNYNTLAGLQANLSGGPIGQSQDVNTATKSRTNSSGGGMFFT